MSTSNKVKPSKKDEDNEDEVPFIKFEDDDYIKKWSGPLLLGPLIPAVFSIIVIFSGQLVLNTWVGSCGYALNSFVSAAIAVCYLFLLFYTWIFLGDEIKIHYPDLGLSNVVLLTPITTLQFVFNGYVVIGVISFIVWIVGTALLNLSIFCVNTAPGLYSYSQFLVIAYWFGFSITILLLIKLIWGKTIANLVKEQTRTSTIDEMEEKIFSSKFSKFDPEHDRKIKVNDLDTLLEDLGVFVPNDELSSLKVTLDQDETGYIEYKPLLSWFRNLNTQLDNEAGEDMNNSVEGEEEDGYAQDELEASAMFSASKKGKKQN